MEFEIKDGIYLPKKAIVDDILAHEPMMCARYARLVALQMLTGSTFDPDYRVYTPSNAWNFKYHNRSVWKRGEVGEFKSKSLKNGQLLGIRLPFSEYLGKRDERNNLVLYTHMAAFVGRYVINGEQQAIIDHNVAGKIGFDDLNKFLRDTGAVVMEIFSPMNERLLKKIK